MSAEAKFPAANMPVTVLAWLGTLAALYFARDLLVPIVLSLLLALLLMPIVRRLRTWRVPDSVSAFVLVATIVVLFGIGVLTLASEAQRWVVDAPKILSRASQLVPTEIGPFKHLKAASKAMQDMTRSDDEAPPLQVEVASHDTMFAALGVSTHFIAAAIIVFVLTFFLLAFHSTLLNQAVESRDSYNDKRTIVQLLRNVEDGVSRYLLTITLINCGLGVVAGLMLWMLEIPNPVLWGVMVTMLNYVPHVGAFFCMGILFLVGAVTHESLAYGLTIAGMFAVLTSLESYFITPYVLSRSLQLSPLAIIIAILFWGWMWGIAGGLMAAPLLAVIKLTCDQFESLHGLAAVLTGETEKPHGPHY
ncbi:AI-2 transport protein TqsA [Anatilimnocola aggregata]|uniref:AI-2 transport protein TqsA n=1 Tax=Anatilimnocola aggregata TaxID=2528021 RepID=A0A517Y4Z6_9BACT|nr:AI-2E family transporter [Anatilimnocola aggregata]QDU25305.1 AI-2 transport protein TqsA [Anatilimnocola aggregata]